MKNFKKKEIEDCSENSKTKQFVETLNFGNVQVNISANALIMNDPSSINKNLSESNAVNLKNQGSQMVSQIKKSNFIDSTTKKNRLKSC